jgi:Calcineurin-like phosphoesterase
MDPSATPPARRPDAAGAARSLGLVAIVFAATMLLLAGLMAVLRPAGDIADASSRAPDGPPTAAAAIAPTPSPTPSPTTTASPTAAASPGTPTTGPSASAAPTGAPSPSADPVLVGAGDIATCDSKADEATAKLLESIPGTVFTAGDNAYGEGTARQFRECYDPSWGRVRDRTWPAPGNHDWGTKDLAGYRDYFGAAAVNADGDPWYARDLGTWRVIVLDSDCSKVGGCGSDSRQGRWLADELAANPRTCTVAIFHHPRFSSGDVHGNDRAMDAFWRPLYAAGVDVVVNGHDHIYERFAPQDPGGRLDRRRGIREFVAGTGGAGLYGFDKPRPNSELRAAIAHGVLALTLHDGSYDWRYTTTGDSGFSDAGTATCH